MPAARLPDNWGPTIGADKRWWQREPGSAALQIIRRNLLAALVLSITCLASTAQAATLIRDAEIERTLRQMATPIFSAAGYSPDVISIYIIQDRTLNAFVANGNNMFLHTGLLQILETPEELIAVIAHETGHIAGGHQTRRMVNLRNAKGPALLGLLAGIAVGAVGGPQAGAAIVAGSQGATVRGLLAYSRGEEASADQAALSYLARANVNPIGMRDVLSRFRGQEVFNVGNQDPFVLTHPLSTERMQLIEHKVEEAQGRNYPADPDREYWHGRMRAKLIGFLDSPERVLDRLEGKPETEEVLYQKSVALYKVPDKARALEAVDRLIALRPKDPFYIELKGQILFETGDAEAAVPFYRQASNLAPGEPLLEAGLGRVLLALNQPATDAEALKVLKDARRRDPGDALALHALATAYSRAGDPGMAALATAERYALQGNMEDADLHARRAADALPEGSPGWLRAQDIISLDLK